MDKKEILPGGGSCCCVKVTGERCREDCVCCRPANTLGATKGMCIDDCFRLCFFLFLCLAVAFAAAGGGAKGSVSFLGCNRTLLPPFTIGTNDEDDDDDDDDEEEEAD